MSAATDSKSERTAAAASAMLAALEEARETILQFLHARWSEAEGPDAVWLARIDTAIAAAKAAGIKAQS